MLDAPVVAVHIPPLLRQYSHGQDAVTVSGETVGEALEALDHECPGILHELLDGKGGLSPRMEVFLGGQPLDTLTGLSTPIELEESIYLIRH
ncbi:hypothetical protein [Azovibrio restrictus]|uniref:hypothetical protein n=1 Tax=Azovibrio restrictus TaxID=146938 RepID=UPI0004210D80|nr:hypothetical protein [Azovibrio restrictus]MCE1171821.1 hypothetical protein [Azovibrio sp.]